MRKPLVLVAADDAAQGKSIQAVLKQFGFRTLAAADGQAAYELFVENQPDAVVLDVHARDGILHALGVFARQVANVSQARFDDKARAQVFVDRLDLG